MRLLSYAMVLLLAVCATVNAAAITLPQAIPFYNATGNVVTDLVIEIGAGGEFVPVTANSFDFDLVSANISTLVFDGGSVPEPAIMSMLGLGAFGIIRKRNRA